VIKASVHSECHVQANRQSPDQVFKAFSFSLDTAEESAAALQAASDAHGGQVPDAVFACAGAAKPMYLIEMQPEDLSRGMANGYWIQAWTAFVSQLFNSVSDHGQEHDISL
jgi:3-dehydrosphinganine reductase